MKQEKKAFTLIELLVVIAIIGLLSTLSILALNQARARARDTKRISDVRQIQTALELYYNEVGDYPDTGEVKPGEPIESTNNTYLAAVPTPPTPVDGSGCPGTQPEYTYAKDGSGQGGTATYTIKYCLGADVNTVPGNSMQTATPAGIVLP
ncbi:MAG: prepilin-type N-terminal cleavage/methylation domain-containing protein [Patescibacteria group bacterium]|nr:prepilin-type N-terminal cleavage/methylation domain-containing protein [Patescibacteria group bacterium]